MDGDLPLVLTDKGEIKHIEYLNYHHLTVVQSSLKVKYRENFLYKHIIKLLYEDNIDILSTEMVELIESGKDIQVKIYR